jgi:hypothetical protein
MNKNIKQSANAIGSLQSRPTRRGTSLHTIDGVDMEIKFDDDFDIEQVYVGDVDITTLVVDWSPRLADHLSDLERERHDRAIAIDNDNDQ